MKRGLLDIDLARLMFWAALLFLVFILGGVFSSKGWEPYQTFSDGFHGVKNFLRESSRTRPWILEKHRYAGDGVINYNKDQAFDGYTLMQGWLPGGTQVRLIDMSGEVVNAWPIDYFEVWPNPTHVVPEANIPSSRFYFHIQGIRGLPDGSIVVNFANLGTAKFDRCGNIVWKLDRMTHHSITANADGTFWIPANGNPLELPDELLLFGLEPSDMLVATSQYDDRLLLIGRDGETLREISVLRALINGGFARELYDAGQINRLDPTHVNDIEVVTPALAVKLDGVNPGDLLISIRQMHMLAILDKDTGNIKWHKQGPWIRQHDPDITAGGNIEVFNNNTGYQQLGDSIPVKGSSIMVLDPLSGASRIVYPVESGEKFYSDIQGEHQLLANGNRLITESKAGRAFEVNAAGEIVWEFVKPYDEEYASLIENAIRYEKSHFNVESWACSK